jgi:hypothetical protein
MTDQSSKPAGLTAADIAFADYQRARLARHQLSTCRYGSAIADLRRLLLFMGRHEFRAYGYAVQLRDYRKCARLQEV